MAGRTAMVGTLIEDGLTSSVTPISSLFSFSSFLFIHLYQGWQNKTMVSPCNYSRLCNNTFGFSDKFFTSSTDSGNGSPRVSGKKRAKIAPTKDDEPMIVMAKVLEDRLAMIGAKTAPILAKDEQAPTAVFLMPVGYISAV